MLYLERLTLYLDSLISSWFLRHIARMEPSQEMRTFGGNKSQDTARNSQVEVAEIHDRDTLALAKTGKKQVLQVSDFATKPLRYNIDLK